LSILSWLVIEYAAYMGGLGLLAWHWERRTGRDAFGLVMSLAAAIVVANAVAGSARVSAWLALATGAAIGALLFVAVEEVTERLGFSLLEVLFLATSSLLLFDGLTEHSPVALGAAGRGVVPALVGVAALVWIWEAFSGGESARLTLRIGREGGWAVRFWRSGLERKRGLPVMILGSFFPCIGLPLATTGVLSSSILKDVAVAILLARVTGSRPPGFLLAASATLGALRLLAGYVVAGSAGPPLVEGAAFVAGLVWLRHKGFRAVLDRRYDR
jgi:hypothetical protein